MTIAQLVSNLHNVSPAAGKAIYSHVAWLTNSLVNLNHQVTLFAATDSNTRANLVSIEPGPLSSLNLSEENKKHYMNALISKCYSQAKNFDIIHSHFNFSNAFYENLVDTPTINSIHSPIKEELKPLLLNFKSRKYVSFSLAQRKIMPELNWVGNVYHGIDTNLFSFNPLPKDYFLYIGRITKEKGVHLAIKAAKTAKVPLIIAGRSYRDEGYWQAKIEKHIDGKNIRYIGEAGFKEKIELYQNAKAVLFPTQYREIFGLVMIEAMACGTPVIGWKKGSVAEIISDKKTGFVVNSIDHMVNAIKSIDSISREETRKRAELYFSIKKMVSSYERVYQRVIGEHLYKRNGNKS